MITWPQSLPQVPLDSGYSSQRVGGYVAQNMDDGPPYQRPTGMSYAVVTPSYLLTTQQMNVLEDFYRFDLANGTQRFMWPNPLGNSEIATPTTFATEATGTDTYTLTDGVNPVKNPIITSIHQTDWQGRQLLYPTPRTNLLIHSNFEGGIGFATFSGNVNAASGLVWPGAITTGAAFTSNSAVSYLYNPGPSSGPVNMTFSVIIKMDDGGAPVIKDSNSDSDFMLVLNSGAYAASNIQALDGGIYRCSAAISVSTMQNNFGVVKYSTNSARTFVVSAYDLKVSSVLTSYIPTTSTPVTLTDYTLSDNQITLAQVSDGATLDWTGTYGNHVVQLDQSQGGLKVSSASAGYWDVSLSLMVLS